jgi:uroporphyrinogen decarboxylase
VKLAQQNYSEHFAVLKLIAETYHPDAVFPLMDLCVEANASGRLTLFPKMESATVVKETFTESDLACFERTDIRSDSRLRGYIETEKLMARKLPGNILRGAYVTGPYTLAGLLLGADEAALLTVMDPEYLHRVGRAAIRKTKDYIDLLIGAGADIICILEPSAVMLGPEQFTEFSADYVHSICESMTNPDVAVVYHICGNTMHLIDRMAKSGVHALSLDSPGAGVKLIAATQKVSKDIILIGNVSPIGSMLYGAPAEVEEETRNLLQEMKGYPNFILSTGCDLPLETPTENIQAFMRAGKNYTIT